MQEPPEKLTKPYDPAETEARIYEIWEKSGYFNPDNLPIREDNPNWEKTFSMVLPPPNVTGVLHAGHAATVTIEDIMVRYHRMKGYKTLWIPGTDHAAIATQSKVESIIYKEEGLRRHDLGREELLRRIKAFAQDSHDTIINQVKRTGASIDWSREAYTFDDARNLAVRTTFKKMYDDGLIYRGERIVNWDPKMQTTVSDDEIEWVEEKTPFYYLKYGPFEIATARPETKFGDKYVVMHPADTRYKQYEHGQKIELEWINGPITATIIKDEAIDMEFGTGVMTITPWHDMTDYEISGRHNLEKEQIINLLGKLMPIAGEYAGMSINKARPLIIEKLQEKGLVSKTEENYIHRVATNSRGGGKIEPQILKQWFVDVNKEFTFQNSKIEGIASGEKATLKKLMLQVVNNKQIEIIPDRFEKIYFNWVENLRDWCISRQIWFGHQIPVWYRGNEIYCGIEAPEGDGWEQDPDTLDTWFSSGLWSFSTLGWPKETDDFKTFHPLSVMETGADIIFFWVARMILMTTYLLGDIPFRTVYFHGLVRDGQGRKMSKSLGNSIDPLTMSDKFGTDALRLSLIIGTGPGNDSKVSEEKIKGYKHFANKLWNITRFVLSQTDASILEKEMILADNDQERLAEFEVTVKEVTSDMENFRFYLAGEKLYHYAWHIFADKVIEESKKTFDNGNEASKDSSRWLLMHILTDTLKLLHPFIPFVTEEIWGIIYGSNKNLLIVEEWPAP